MYSNLTIIWQLIFDSLSATSANKAMVIGEFLSPTFVTACVDHHQITITSLLASSAAKGFAGCL